MSEQLFNKIQIPEKLRHSRDFIDFFANFYREWEKVCDDMELIKQELKRLQDEKANA